MAVKFGVGRYLYRLSAQWVDYDAVKKQLTQLPQLPAQTASRPVSCSWSSALATSAADAPAAYYTPPAPDGSRPGELRRQPPGNKENLARCVIGRRTDDMPCGFHRLQSLLRNRWLCHGE